MNFKQIAEQYPKAWERFEEIETVPYPIRNLYDFFDSEGIGVFVYPYEFNAEPNTEKLITLLRYMILTKWEGEMVRHDSCKIDPEKRGYPTRPEAEEQAFTRAFEILENKLKGV